MVTILASVPDVNWCVHHVITVSPTIAEVYLPESQVVPFRTAMADYVVADVALSAADIRHRLAAYRGGYFKHLRMAALEGLPTMPSWSSFSGQKTIPTRGSARYDRDCLRKGRRQ